MNPRWILRAFVSPFRHYFSQNSCELGVNFLERRQNEVRRTSLPRTRVNNREAGPGLLRPHPRCLSASGATSATDPAQLAHLFFESLHPFCQPVEALVDLLPPIGAPFVLCSSSSQKGYLPRGALSVTGVTSPPADRLPTEEHAFPIPNFGEYPFPEEA